MKKITANKEDDNNEEIESPSNKEILKTFDTISKRFRILRKLCKTFVRIL